MEKAYFPMFVDISEMKIVAVGGGKIASRRVAVLTQFARNITVIAPETTGSLKELEAAGKIHCVRRGYKEEDIREADMVLAATNNKRLNHRISIDCREVEQRSGRRIMINVADDRSLCDFYFPSVITRDEFVIGINSGGNNPGKVKHLREKLEEEL